MLRSFLVIAVVYFLLFATRVHARSEITADSILCRKLMDSAQACAISDPRRCIMLATKQLELATAMRSIQLIGLAKLYIGLGHFHQGEISEARALYEEVLKSARTAKIATLEAGALNRLGWLCTVTGELDKAMKYYQDELVIQQRLRQDIYVADCYANFAVLFGRQEMLPEARLNHAKARALYHALKDTFNEAKMLQSIGELYVRQGIFDSAFLYITSSLQLLPTADGYLAMATYQDTLGHHDSALTYFKLAYDGYKQQGYREWMGEVLAHMGQTEFYMGRLSESEKHLLEALAIHKELGYMQEVYCREQDLSELYAKKRDFEKAYVHFVAFHNIRDSINGVDMQARLTALNAKFEVKEATARNEALKKDNDLQRTRLQRRNVVIYASAGTILALLVIGMLLMRQQRLRAAQQKIELEQKQLRAQMNPHFIFNCLNSIQHFILANDVKNANKYLSGFATLMRQTLENAREGVITLRQEIQYLENYLVLEQVRFEEKFTYKIICANDVDQDATELPSMIIQPYIENAIRHGLCFLDDREGLLRVSFFADGDVLCCQVEDNGIGRERSQQLSASLGRTYESRGMELTRQRLQLVSSGVGSDYSIEVVDKKDASGKASGTSITIRFPKY